MHGGLSAAQKADLTRDESVADQVPAAEDITHPVILICGHMARDSRCGVLGPVLESAFRADLKRRGIHAEVGQISHIGGHKYAGNVIVYIPPTWGNALAGTGIWYGRVGPENVEGVVGETIVAGRVVREFLRGGITRDGGSIGRMVEAQERGDEDGVLKLKPRARGVGS
jgi:leucyl-tRNA synthetase